MLDGERSAMRNRLAELELKIREMDDDLRGYRKAGSNPHDPKKPIKSKNGICR